MPISPELGSTHEQSDLEIENELLETSSKGRIPGDEVIVLADDEKDRPSTRYARVLRNYELPDGTEVSDIAILQRIGERKDGTAQQVGVVHCAVVQQRLVPGEEKFQFDHRPQRATKREDIKQLFEEWNEKWGAKLGNESLPQKDMPDVMPEFKNWAKVEVRDTSEKGTVSSIVWFPAKQEFRYIVGVEKGIKPITVNVSGVEHIIESYLYEASQISPKES